MQRITIQRLVDLLGRIMASYHSLMVNARLTQHDTDQNAVNYVGKANQAICAVRIQAELRRSTNSLIQCVCKKDSRLLIYRACSTLEQSER